MDEQCQYLSINIWIFLLLLFRIRVKCKWMIESCHVFFLFSLGHHSSLNGDDLVEPVVLWRHAVIGEHSSHFRWTRKLELRWGGTWATRRGWRHAWDSRRGWSWKEPSITRISGQFFGKDEMACLETCISHDDDDQITQLGSNLPDSQEVSRSVMLVTSTLKSVCRGSRSVMLSKSSRYSWAGGLASLESSDWIFTSWATGPWGRP